MRQNRKGDVDRIVFGCVVQNRVNISISCLVIVDKII